MKKCSELFRVQSEPIYKGSALLLHFKNELNNQTSKSAIQPYEIQKNYFTEADSKNHCAVVAIDFACCFKKLLLRNFLGLSIFHTPGYS